MFNTVRYWIRWNLYREGINANFEWCRFDVSLLFHCRCFRATESSQRKFVFVCAYIQALIRMKRMELLIRSSIFFNSYLFITWAFWQLSKLVAFECPQFASWTRLMWIIWEANERSSLRKIGLNLLDQLEIKYSYLPFYTYFCLIAGDSSIFIFLLFLYWKFSEYQRTLRH